MYDSRKIEPYALGYEPDWLVKMRKTETYPKNNYCKWTELESKRLVNLYHRGKSISELAEIFERTEYSVEWKLKVLIKEKLK